jgi:hypothetical protein
MALLLYYYSPLEYFLFIIKLCENFEAVFFKNPDSFFYSVNSIIDRSKGGRTEMILQQSKYSELLDLTVMI